MQSLGFLKKYKQRKGGKSVALRNYAYDYESLKKEVKRETPSIKLIKNKKSNRNTKNNTSRFTCIFMLICDMLSLVFCALLGNSNRGRRIEGESYV